MIELLLYLYAESPVHAGAADSLGVLDLPIQREASTGYPVIWGQSLKGALRQHAEEAGWGEQVTTVFGSPVREEEERRETSPGHLLVGDAQLVAMPVPTLRRTFAWVTSELALSRLARKYTALPAACREGMPPVPGVAPDAGVAATAGWTGTRGEVLGPCLVPLGEQPGADLAQWAERLAGHALGASGEAEPGDPVFGHFAAKLREDLLLVGSDVMPTLLRECTELTARVQLSDAKTVQNGPFYSEYLPAETILAASLSLRPPAQAHLGELRELLHGKLIRVGGDETLGKGLVWARLVGADR